MQFFAKLNHYITFASKGKYYITFVKKLLAKWLNCQGIIYNQLP